MPARHLPRPTALGPRSTESNSPLTLPEMRGRQNAKIREFGGALVVAGLRTLDQQAAALTLSRSTTWHLLQGNHKGSGLSAGIINRMLASPLLPANARAKLLEYVAEKAAGHYGDSEIRLRGFIARLSNIVLQEAMEVERRKAHSRLVARRAT